MAMLCSMWIPFPVASHDSHFYICLRWDEHDELGQTKNIPPFGTTNSAIFHRKSHDITMVGWPSCSMTFCLIGGWPTPLKNMTKSAGMMTFPNIWKNKIHVPNQQPVLCFAPEKLEVVQSCQATWRVLASLCSLLPRCSPHTTPDGWCSRHSKARVQLPTSPAYLASSNKTTKHDAIDDNSD